MNSKNFRGKKVRLFRRFELFSAQTFFLDPFYLVQNFHFLVDPHFKDQQLLCLKTRTNLQHLMTTGKSATLGMFIIIRVMIYLLMENGLWLLLEKNHRWKKTRHNGRTYNGRYAFIKATLYKRQSLTTYIEHNLWLKNIKGMWLWMEHNHQWKPASEQKQPFLSSSIDGCHQFHQRSSSIKGRLSSWLSSIKLAVIGEQEDRQKNRLPSSPQE